jgi:hypothetical protein
MDNEHSGTLTCCLCSNDIEVAACGWEGGHNPSPLGESSEDRCCDECNTTKVIPARLRDIGLLLRERDVVMLKRGLNES